MKRLYERFRAFAQKVANIQADVVLFIIYFLLIVPLSLIIKITHKKRMLFYKDRYATTYWSKRPSVPLNHKWAKKQ